ncbi:hypothetical protein ACJMK2_040244 [Sinanodonta woodiana]|uniref:Peptidase S8/S53 domain-containing protein n=1 Tax=Sinanodonta woodiana TaxID=1069815 RepID=A0ABD3WFG1_SINWO
MITCFYSAEDPYVSLNTTEETLENGNLVEGTSGYRNTVNVKFAKVESRSKAKLKIIDGVELVEEQIYEKRVLKSLDAYWVDMWAVNGDVVPSMKVLEAWNLGYSGRGIYIAVVDSGIDIYHEDLRVNMRSSYHYDFVSDDGDPSPVGSVTHGTNCAGLVGAEKDNNQCIAGIAYNANLVGIRLISILGTTDVMDGTALSHEQSTIDIYTNSWGSEDGHGFNSIRTYTYAAIEQGIRTGRNGKGNIYVFAAGNGGLDDNCNGDAFTRSRYIITISSINSDGVSATYAEVCTPALAVAYGGGGGTNKYLYSTSPMDLCTGRHGGTSFSAPQAAAIIALTLEANPQLTWRDVQHLIVRTSKKHDLLGRKYNWQINGANLSVHPVLGFGLMDAEAMVKTAQTWRNVPIQCTYTSLTQNPHRDLKDVALRLF